MIMETWKTIPNFSLYQASTLGNLKTFNWKNKGKERIMKPALDGSGYLRTMLKGDDGKFHTVKVHRIIGSTFIDNHENKPQINHKNCVKSDNRVINLEWCTISENQIHAYKEKRRNVSGENNPATSLTDKQVLEIRVKYTYNRKGGKGIAGIITKKVLADEYGVNVWVIKQIVNKHTWKHLL
jgi:hypothetical protein